MPRPMTPIKRHELNKLQKRLRRETGRAISDFDMIEEGDRVMVCVSGGKDSFALLDMLMNLKRHAPVSFDLHAVNLDQKQPGFPRDVLPSYFESKAIPYTILEEDTFSLVTEMVPEGKTYCGWCSRFRRGILYKFARRNGFDKIALGHHRDDIVETLFLNMFFGGKLKAMPAKLLSDDGKNVVIRPLAYCREDDLTRYAQAKGFPIIPCNLCGSQGDLKRVAVGKLLVELESQIPNVRQVMLAALRNVRPSHLLDRAVADAWAERADEHPPRR